MTHMLSKKLATYSSDDGQTIEFFCPGCKETHIIPVGAQHEGAHWGWNGDTEKPTLTPSILVRSGHFASHYRLGDHCWCTFNKEDGTPDAHPYKCVVCHSFVTNGQILFLQDCTHELAGQTVDIPDYPTKEQ